MLIAFACMTGLQAQNYPAGSPVAVNGKLKVSGTQLVNACGDPVQLRGMSTHGPQWFGNCISKSAVETLKNDWGITVFRWAMYVQETGYITNPSGYRTKIDEMADICEELGIYFLIDWHVLTPGDPNANKSESLEFWQYMSNKHGKKPHILYEICNEPNGVDWSKVKSYADDVVKLIRDNNDETVIIVGTPTWSQDVDEAAKNKINSTNIMYTLHFYAGSHKSELRAKAQTALDNNTPIFVTEFGTSSASGDGGYSPDETKTWISWLNERKISWICWSFSDHSEVSAALIPGSCNESKWNNTSTSGTLIKGLITESVIPFIACSNQNQGNDNNNNNNNEQNNNNNNNNNGQNQGNENNNNNNNQNNEQNNNNNNTQPEQPVTYPTLAQSINNRDVYRIVNKKSGKVMSISNNDEIKQATREENRNEQLVRLFENDGYYVMQMFESKNVLTNKYVNNDGTQISAETESEYDNPSQKWSIKKDGDWFKISNKSDWSGDKVISVDGGSKDEGANVVLWTSNSNDEQYWGFEYVMTPQDASLDNPLFDNIVLAPTMIEDEFHIYTPEGDATLIDIYTMNGVLVRHFDNDCTYNISDLQSGNYVVIVSGIDGKRILTQLIVKK